MENLILDKSFSFAIRTVKLYRHLCTTQHEYVLSKQLLRAGTSIGANIAEAQHAQSRADFLSKLSISLKETTETKYWLRLMEATDYLTSQEAASMLRDCSEMEKLLVSIIKTTKQKMKQS